MTFANPESQPAFGANPSQKAPVVRHLRVVPELAPTEIAPFREYIPAGTGDIRRVTPAAPIDVGKFLANQALNYELGRMIGDGKGMVELLGLDDIQPPDLHIPSMPSQY